MLTPSRNKFFTCFLLVEKMDYQRYLYIPASVPPGLVSGEGTDSICSGAGVCGGGVRRGAGENPSNQETEEEGGLRGNH